MSLVGRAIAIVGIVTGLLAVGLPFAPESRYVDDGTVAAFLLVLLCVASWLPAEIGRDLLGAAAGAAAFGFFLFIPAVAAFDSFGILDSGAWLGLCTALIPIGALVGRAAEHDPGPVTTTRPAPTLGGLGLPLTLAGLVLIVVGIWLDASSDGGSYWNFSASGHAVGILMLLLVVVNAGLTVGRTVVPMPTVGDLDLLVAAATFGFLEAGLVSTAFEDFGSLGTGGWLEACAGALLLLGVLKLRAEAAATTDSPAAMPSVAPAQ